MPAEQIASGTDAPSIEEDGLSIGALSRSTGIGIHSLRMWERRYGAPKSYRRESGHRRYPADEIPRLRAVSRALSMGYRAGEVADRSIAELDEIMQSGPRSNTSNPAPESNREVSATIKALLAAACAYDERKFDELLGKVWKRTGTLDFIEDYASPFLQLIGDGWLMGTIHISQEHFAAERLSAFLRGLWDRNAAEPDLPVFVFATPPGDLHRLGLDMCAAIATESGCRALFLGPQVPPEEIQHAVAHSGAAAACISFSRYTQKSHCIGFLAELRRLVPESVDIFCGGHGSHGTDGVAHYIRLGAFREHLMRQGSQ